VGEICLKSGSVGIFNSVFPICKIMNFPGRLMTILIIFGAAGILIAALIGYASWEASTYRITALVDRDAPEGIVFISDPHVRPENINQVREIIKQINRLQPSIVLIGGDFLYGSVDDPSYLELWRGIDAPVYAVLGNHDYLTGIKGSGTEGRVAWVLESILRSRGDNTSRFYSDNPDLASADALERILEQNGIRVLRNEAVDLTLNGTRTIIVGVDDVWAGRAYPPSIPDTDAYTIYLVHEPLVRAEWTADLVLSGHTHGGQFHHALFSVLYQLDIVDVRGLSWKGETPLYVSRGIGTSTFRHEYRFFTPPEIVFINPSGGPKPGWTIVSVSS
jgi:predicted MPP superfamily phosphohydrolase